MHRQTINLMVAVISFTACALPGGPPSVTPLPSPIKLGITTKLSDFSPQEWTFNFHNEARTYYSTSQTILDSDPPDSIGRKDTISITTRFTVIIDRSQIPVSISGHIDKVIFEPGSRGSSDRQKISTPIDFSGVIDSSRLVLNIIVKPSTTTSQPKNNSCSNPASSLLGEVRGEIALLPVHLQTNSTWADTITTVTCSGKGLPSTLETIRSYQVINPGISGTTPTLLIKRAEYIRLIGNGTQDQHQIRLDGEGTGSSDITLDLATGTILAIESYQELRLIIILSGQTKYFTQLVRQQINLIP